MCYMSNSPNCRVVSYCYKNLRALSLSLVCSKFYWLFLPALFKKFIHCSFLFSYHYLLFPFCSFWFYCFRYWYSEKHGLDTYFVLDIVLMSLMHIHTSKIVSELSHHWLSWNCLISRVIVYTDIIQYLVFIPSNY